MIDRDVGVERARQRDVLHDGDALFAGDGDHLPGDMVLALGQHGRQQVVLFLVVDGHGEVGRVRHDHRRAAGALHLVVGEHLLVQLLALALDLGVALRLLVLALHLVLGHFELLGVLVFLEEIVEGGDRGVGEADADGHGLHHRHHAGQEGRQAAVGHPREAVGGVAHDGDDDVADDGDLEAGLEEFDHALDREDLLGLLQGVELVQVGLERLKRQQGADLDETGARAGDQPDEQEGQGDQNRLHHDPVGDRLERGLEGQRIEMRRQQDQFLELREQPVPQQADGAEQGDHQDGGGDILALRHLPLGACVALLLGGGLFGFFRGHGA